MKRRTLTLVSLIFVMLISCFGLFACAHKHEFSKQDASEAYLAVEATCTEKAQYYYSCECGEKGTETFEYGEPLGHDHSELKNSETEHWYECVCGDKATVEAHTGGTATCTAKAVCEVCNTAYGELLAHEYVTTEFKKNEFQHWYECACGAKDAVEAHTGGTATCTEQAICEDCGEDYGALAPHVHDEQKHNETKHWNECVCGDKANVSAHAYTIFKQEGGQKWYECACGQVDERMLIDVDAEVLMSLNSKKLFFNKTDLEGAEIIGAIYGGNSILTDGVLDVSAFAINQANPYVLHIETSVNRYSLNNVIAYTEVFEDTAESRELMVKIFSGRLEENGILNGSYALVENLNFNHFALDENGNKTYDANGNVLYSNKEAFYCDGGFQRPTGDVDAEGKPITEKAYTTFSGIFDGRGFALNDVLQYDGNYYGMFGYYFADGATIKNVAINGVSKYESKTNVNQNGGYHSVLFYAPVGWDTDASKEVTLNLQNVYIYRKQTSDQQSSAIISYKGANGEYTKLNVDNVVVINEFASELEDRRSSSFYGWQKTFAEGSNISDLFIVSNGTRGAYNKVGKANVSNYVYYQATKTTNPDGSWSYDYNSIADAINAMKAAGNDYSGFDSKYWTIIEGIPAWNSINTIVKATNSDGEVLKSISSTTAGEEFIITVESLGEIVEEGVEIAVTGDDVVALNGNVIVVKENVNGEATITVTYGAINVTYAVVVDSRPAVEFNEEVLLSKANGKIYLNGTSLKADEVAYGTVAYGDVTIGGENAVDTSLIVDSEGNQIAVNTKFALIVVTNSGKYNFTNVKMYDEVFENTAESRKAMVDLLSAGDRTTSGSSSAFKKATLTGYYVLAENLTFSAYAEDGTTVIANEAFSNNGSDAGSNLFKGTFDGRGYTLNNVIIYEAQTAGGMFGIAGDGATLKNFAINGLAMVTGKASTGYNFAGAAGNYSLFFLKPETVDSKITFENIYIYRDITTKTSYNGVFFNEGIATETVYTDYTYVSGETSTTYKVEYTYYSFGQLTFNNVIVENKTSTSPIFTGGRVLAYQVEWDEASQKYVRVKNASNKDVSVYTYEYYGAQGPATSNVDAGGNVIINGFGSDYAYASAVVKDTDSISNTYFITTGKFGRDAAAPSANANGDEFKLYASEAKMIEANNDYTSFSSAYWTVAEGGIPAWKTLPVVAE